MTPATASSPRASTWLPGFMALSTVWGLAFLFISVGLTTLTPFGVAFARNLLGALTLLAWSGIRRMPLSSSLRLWGLSFAFSLFMNVIPSILFAFAETYISSSLAGVLNATTPLMTVLITVLVFREQRVSITQLVGILVGFFGIVMLTGVLFEPQQAALLGAILVLIATACYGFALPFARRFLTPSGLPATSLATMQMAAGALWFVFVVPFVSLQSGPWTLASIVSISALGILGSGFAYVWNFRTINVAGSAVASTVTYVLPVIAVIAGVIFIHETIHWYQLVGGAIVLLSAALVQERIRITSRTKG
jgi:drug/metabolite transporter (DMT)-like permease